MTEIKNYTVVSNRSKSTFENNVKMHIAAKWVPLGGASYSDELFVQSMVKYKTLSEVG